MIKGINSDVVERYRQKKDDSDRPRDKNDDSYEQLIRNHNGGLCPCAGCGAVLSFSLSERAQGLVAIMTPCVP